jgi:Sec-independent protein translocase protein TatA
MAYGDGVDRSEARSIAREAADSERYEREQAMREMGQALRELRSELRESVEALRDDMETLRTELEAEGAARETLADAVAWLRKAHEARWARHDAEQMR